MMENQTNLPVAKLDSTNDVSVFSASEFDHYQRIAKTLSTSDLVPTIYKGGTPKAIANCLLAIELSNRMGASVFLVMQNLDIIHGRPAWRAQFKAAQANSSGRFRPLRYEWDTKPVKVKTTYSTWIDDGVKADGSPKRRKVDKDFLLPENKCCRAVTEGMDGKTYEGPWISYELAVKEGWWHRDGSKWESMGEKMLMYRAASWFVDVFDPGASMGLKTTEEVQDAVWEEISSESHRPKRNKIDDLNDAAGAAGGVSDDDDNTGGDDPMV